MTSLEDAPDLFEAPESDEDRAGYRLRSLSHLTWAMRKLAGIERERLEVSTTAQAEIDRIQDWAAREDARWARDASWFRSLAEEYALTQRAVDPRRKSVETPYGVAKTREQAGAWEFDDAAFLAWASENHEDLVDVKVETRVRKGDAKKVLQVAGNGVVDPVTGEEVPGIKVGDPTVTASVSVDLHLLADDENDR